jgi:hypothetical protein
VITVNEAFTKFKSNLELTAGEQKDAIRRREQVYEHLCGGMAISERFLTGSYARWTKTKPLKDVDMFVLLADSERGYLDRRSDEILAVVGAILEPVYGEERFGLGRHSVRVDFGRRVDADVSDGVMSFDIVPAFRAERDSDGFLIPNAITRQWIKSDPRVHKSMAEDANKAFDLKWKPVVKMIKKWNEHNGKPVKPSFLLEVMAMELLDPPFTSYPYDLRQYFATAADRIREVWRDPAGLGPPVSERMNNDPGLTANAVTALKSAEAACTLALRYQREGRTGDALAQWQQFFGPLFVKS